MHGLCAWANAPQGGGSGWQQNCFGTEEHALYNIPEDSNVVPSAHYIRFPKNKTIAECKSWTHQDEEMSCSKTMTRPHLMRKEASRTGCQEHFKKTMPLLCGPK